MQEVERISVLMRAAERKAGVSPCKDCPKRYPGCSGHCSDYADWKHRRNAAKGEALSATKCQRIAENTQLAGRARYMAEKKHQANIVVKVPR